MLRMFPGLSFNYAANHSTNSFLINDSYWREAGLQISFNLLGLLSVPAQSAWPMPVWPWPTRNAWPQMAVLSQLHIARLQFANAAHQYERADAIAEVDQRLTQHVDNLVKVDKQTRQDSVAQQTARPFCPHCGATRRWRPPAVGRLTRLQATGAGAGDRRL